MRKKETNYSPFKLEKAKKFTLGRRQAERVNVFCNEVGKTPEQVIKEEINKKVQLDPVTHFV